MGGEGEGFEPSFIHRFDAYTNILKRRIKWAFYILNKLQDFIVVSKTMLSVV
jgi:hypothetical protein